jgi:hypothetical protein
MNIVTMRIRHHGGFAVLTERRGGFMKKMMLRTPVAPPPPNMTNIPRLGGDANGLRKTSEIP